MMVVGKMRNFLPVDVGNPGVARSVRVHLVADEEALLVGQWC